MRDNLYKLIIRRRTVRLFKQRKIPLKIIKKVINAARIAPSAANLQFLEYLVITKDSLRDKIFPHTRWGGYVWPKRVPPVDKRPTLYVVILINKTKATKPDIRDVGAAAENILLSLLSFGLGSCWIASLNRRMLRKILKIPVQYRIDSVIAAGLPAESPKLETAHRIKYWLDRKGCLHVPKRPLYRIIHFNRLG